jgi:iron-sulfur cluster repair protein YtfE (RIC family)
MIPVEQLFGVQAGESGTLERPLDHLAACHRRIEARLAALERIAAHVSSDPQAAQQAAAACFRFFDTNGVLHTQDEEESVFPRLRPGLNQEERRFLERLEREHEEADRTYLELKAAVQAGAGARCRQLVNRRRLLTAPDLAEISGEMKRRRGL